MNTTSTRDCHIGAPTRGTPRRTPGFTTAAGGFYLCMAGINAGIVAADAETYRTFADTSPWSFVRGGWADIFMAAPVVWGLTLAAGEAALGVLLLSGGRAAQLGWVSIIAFQALLVLFGWGFLLWSVPAAGVLILAARHDWRSLGAQAPRAEALRAQDQVWPGFQAADCPGRVGTGGRAATNAKHLPGHAARATMVLDRRADTSRSESAGAPLAETWMEGRWPLATVLTTLAVAMATATLLGPLAAGELQYRTSPTTLNQLMGSDAASLFVAAPLAACAAVLVARGNHAGPPLGTGVAVYALYTYAQLVIGQEYLRLPGNVDRFFPLLLTVFLLAEAALVLAWRRLPGDLAVPSRRWELTSGCVLLLVAAFLTIGLHLPGMVSAWSDPEAMTEYASAPTPFWMVKLMDLGIVVPVAVCTGIGLLKRRHWARRVLYPLLTGYTLLSLAVSAMATVMLVENDPDGSWMLATGFGLFSAALVILTTGLYRSPLFSPRSVVPSERERHRIKGSADL